MLELLSLLATCSPPPPGFYDTRPPSGSTLPSNAQVVLLSYYQGTPQVTISQEDAIYNVTPIIEHGIARVDVGALGVRGEITLFATATDPNAMSVTATFTVADQADTTPPVFNGINVITYEFMESEPGLCWPGGFGVRAEITPATDDWAPTYYLLYEVLPNDALQYAGSTYHSESRSLGIITFPGYDEVTRCYVAQAYDVAGNVAGEGALGGACVDLRRGSIDAGVIDSGDGDDAMPRDTGLPRDTGVRDTGVADGGVKDTLELDDETGCGCSATVRSTAHSSALLFVIALLALVRRKH